MILFPNCKINLGLSITGKRPDGYHDIITAMVPVDWHDVLELVPNGSDTPRLTVTGNTVDCPSEKNLVVKAWYALKKRIPELPGVDIFLHKVIPDGAGLGGGSSDAAHTLIGLNRLFDLGLTDAGLAQVAGTLGADCPFFIYNRPMVATGIGEVLTPIDIPAIERLHIAIVKPQRSVSTREAYAGITPMPADAAFRPDMLVEPPEAWGALVHNHFEDTVIPLLPECAEIKKNLSRMPGVVYTSMSGSGSAIYALSPRDFDIAELKSLFPDCCIFAGQRVQDLTKH